MILSCFLKLENLRGIFHCFSGNYEQALKAISFNMKLGIGGVVTFKNGKIDKFLKKIPLDNLVLETKILSFISSHLIDLQVL